MLKRRWEIFSVFYQTRLSCTTFTPNSIEVTISSLQFKGLRHLHLWFWLPAALTEHVLLVHIEEIKSLLLLLKSRNKHEPRVPWIGLFQLECTQSAA